jgi:hypothetical protein
LVARNAAITGEHDHSYLGLQHSQRGYDAGIICALTTIKHNSIERHLSRKAKRGRCIGGG